MPSVTAGKVKGCSVGVFACELYGSPARSFGAAGRRWNSQPGRLRHFPRRARNPLPDLFSKHALNEGNRCRIEGEGSGRRGRSQEQEVPSASRRRGRPGRSCYPSGGRRRSAGAPTATCEGACSPRNGRIRRRVADGDDRVGRATQRSLMFGDIRIDRCLFGQHTRYQTTEPLWLLLCPCVRDARRGCWWCSPLPAAVMRRLPASQTKRPN
jgi:hypothetical protein